MKTGKYEVLNIFLSKFNNVNDITKLDIKAFKGQLITTNNFPLTRKHLSGTLGWKLVTTYDTGILDEVISESKYTRSYLYTMYVTGNYGNLTRHRFTRLSDIHVSYAREVINDIAIINSIDIKPSKIFSKTSNMLLYSLDYSNPDFAAVLKHIGKMSGLVEKVLGITLHILAKSNGNHMRSEDIKILSDLRDYIKRDINDNIRTNEELFI